MDALIQNFFNLAIYREVFPFLLHGLWTTIWLSLLVIPIGLVSGLALALLITQTRRRWLRVLAAYAEESIWGGMLALPPGQTEAARSTGLSWWQTTTAVILPQALRLAVPPITNRVISVTKNTALGSVVALSEILNVSQSATSNSGNPTPLMMGAAAYLLIFIPVVLFARWLETRWQWKR